MNSTQFITQLAGIIVQYCSVPGVLCVKPVDEHPDVGSDQDHVLDEVDTHLHGFDDVWVEVMGTVVDMD